MIENTPIMFNRLVNTQSCINDIVRDLNKKISDYDDRFSLMNSKNFDINTQSEIVKIIGILKELKSIRLDLIRSLVMSDQELSEKFIEICEEAKACSYLSDNQHYRNSWEYDAWNASFNKEI